MVTWGDWPLDRVVVLFTALAFAMLWGQLALFHWKARFRRRGMWGPVVYTPLMVVVAGILSAIRGPIMEMAYLALFSLGVVEGLLGLSLHLGGVSRLPGGLNLKNLAVGPPLLLTCLYSLLAILGVIVAIRL